MKYKTSIVLAWFAEHKLYAVPEFQFDDNRKWRFDFAFSPYESKVALEVQGGLFIGGRHSRGPALLKEHEKLNAAAIAGWRILYTTPDQLCMQETVEMIKSALYIDAELN
jgi:hypothetical protein